MEGGITWGDIWTKIRSQLVFKRGERKGREGGRRMGGGRVRGERGDLTVIISFPIPIIIYQKILFAPHIKQIYIQIYFHHFCFWYLSRSLSLFSGSALQLPKGAPGGRLVYSLILVMKVGGEQCSLIYYCVSEWCIFISHNNVVVGFDVPLCSVNAL